MPINTVRFSSFNRAVLTAVAVATLGLSLQACAPLVVGGVAATGVMVAVDRRTSGTQLEDETIELKAASQVRDALGDKGHINFNCFNRQLLLTGEVPTEADKAKVERIAGQVENVRSVVNELAVAGNSSLSQRSSDTLVSGRVKAAIVDDKSLSIHAFDVITERGTVYLMGRVTQREANRVTDVVRSVSGVQRVVRVFEVISEEELARIQPKQPAKNDQPKAGN
ncbi:BON domain-containing protein [Hydrogenophaga soli]|nr:BON domain-containing protein [Burkholderiaceae bacterium]